jgi:hypothetical protein
VAYIDESLLVPKGKIERERNIQDTAGLLDKVGITINVEKSVFTPTRGDNIFRIYC